MTLALGRVPVQPDAPTARRWAQQELTDPVYHRGRSLLERIVDWIAQQLSGLHTAGLPAPAAVLVVVAVLAVIAAVAFWVAGPVRRNHRSPRTRGVLAHDDRRSAARMRADADAAAARGDWSTAVVERFRAIVRSLEERAVLDELPGRTAHEAAGEAGGRLPTVSAELSRAAQLFDDVAYGDAHPSAGDDAALRDVDRRVAAARRESRPSLAGATR
ncbi:DUF4129 domain-containing protein [Cellulomonas alba]|uniref:DUF4129 domain-containing protein n=1 Tax=Cellulomonas alba TaxID=3053467 RepID=A0ABT7SCT1_9CELL|nr:DUF4129 domain-containing protein [Cellulomonas alba]MDM7853992.1 DUF4129 domain-containing protein [Cellulomonas alba]